MTVGLPGVGLGGIFYLVSALTMPVRELVRTLRRESSRARWRLVARQWTLAAGIVVAMWLTGKGVGSLVSFLGARPLSSGMVHGVSSRNALQVSALALSLGTLSFVWIGMHALRLFVRWRAQAARPVTTSSAMIRELAVERETLSARVPNRGPDSGQFRRSS